MSKTKSHSWLDEYITYFLYCNVFSEISPQCFPFLVTFSFYSVMTQIILCPWQPSCPNIHSNLPPPQLAHLSLCRDNWSQGIPTSFDTYFYKQMCFYLYLLFSSLYSRLRERMAHVEFKHFPSMISTWNPSLHSFFFQQLQFVLQGPAFVFLLPIILWHVFSVCFPSIVIFLWC